MPDLDDACRCEQIDASEEDTDADHGTDRDSCDGGVHEAHDANDDHQYTCEHNDPPIPRHHPRIELLMDAMQV